MRHLERRRNCLRGYPSGARARGYPRGARMQGAWLFLPTKQLPLYEWSGLNSYKQTLANVNGVVRLYGHLDRHRDCLRGYPCGVRARGYPRGARILVGFFYQPNNCPYEWSSQNSYNQTIEWILKIRMVF